VWGNVQQPWSFLDSPDGCGKGVDLVLNAELAEGHMYIDARAHNCSPARCIITAVSPAF
jgi:hypothetical protein